MLALVVALASGLFVRVFYGIHGLFQRLRMPAVLKPALGGVLTGVIALVAYYGMGDLRALDVLSFGYGSIQHAMRGELPILLLLVIAFGKMLTTSCSIGSGGSGGVFGPSMVIGGALGGAVGLVARHFFPAVITQPGAFVIVGMAGFFSAAANTPISTLVMVSEMTGNYQLLLPALWVCALAYLLGRRWSLYRHQVPGRLDSPAHRGAILGGILRAVRVGDVIGGRKLHTIPERASLGEVIQSCMTSSQHCYPVVDPAMTGVVTLAQVRHFLDESDSGAPAIAHDLALSPVSTLTPDDDLDRALQSLMSLEVEELPVVEREDPASWSASCRAATSSRRARRRHDTGGRAGREGRFRSIAAPKGRAVFRRTPPPRGRKESTCDLLDPSWWRPLSTRPVKRRCVRRTRSRVRTRHP
ncbi:MAG: chloride channel protein [Candidatus Eisenbacteria bacterium]|nr:chloride channel protein [Candidatus Eisenbacteria bacterium]